MFEDVVKKIECDDISAIAVHHCIQRLMTNIRSANEHEFFSNEVKAEISNLEEDGHRMREFKAQAANFRGNFINF